MKKHKTVRILGIDPGYGRIGVAIIEAGATPKLLFSSCITTKQSSSFPERLISMAEFLEKMIAKWSPTILALETLFLYKNQKTAMRVAEARGVILYLAGKHRFSVYEYAPQEVKETVTGYGRADKKQVENMIIHTLKFPPKARLDDEFDAIAVALTCFYRTRTNLIHKIK